jgi:hypothetical protein
VQVFRQDEAMARYGTHGFQHALVVDIPTGDLLFHHALACLCVEGFVVHMRDQAILRVND